MSFDGFSDRLKSVLNSGKYTQKEAAEKINISEYSFTKYLNGRIPQTEILYKIARLYNKSMEWLLTGKDPIVSKSIITDNLTDEESDELNLFIEFLKYKRNINSQDNNHVATVKEDAITYIPILGDIDKWIPIESIKTYHGYLPNSFIIRTNGDSMIDANISNDDLVIFKVQPMVENGDIALVNVNDKSTIRYFYQNGEECELRSANSSYPPVKYPVDEINIIGKFVQVLEHK